MHAHRYVQLDAYNDLEIHGKKVSKDDEDDDNECL